MLFMHDGGNFDLQSVGILNALKTGDVFLDMIIAMCIPIILRMLFDGIRQLETHFSWTKFFTSWWHRQRYQYRRTVTFRATRDTWGSMRSMDQDTQNSVLIKAIQLYLHKMCNLKLDSADIVLTSTETREDTYYCYDYYDDDSMQGSSKTKAGMLSKYHIVQKPPCSVWHNLGKHGNPAYTVKVQIEENEQDVESKDGGATGNQRCMYTLNFTSTGPGAIDAFIDSAYKWYLDQLRAMEDNSRYMYDLIVPDMGSKSSNNEDGSGGDNGIVYSRYQLSDDRTFGTLFFPQKERLLSIINHFQNKTGKYGIKGYPHKLGLLLHGPPGSGKTSLIKAMAQYTGRSIVNVSLSKITTNTELMSVFFDRRYYIEGESVPVKLGFKDVIFVMEDVDAASKVVRSRGDMESEMESTLTTVDFPQKSLWQMMLESNDSDCQELVKMLMEKSERLKTLSTQPQVLEAMSSRMLALPGLSLVGEPDLDAARVGREAVENAESMLNAYSTVDRFLGTHARSIKALLEAGAEVNDCFVDKLLQSTLENGIALDLMPKLSPLASIDKSESVGSKDVALSSMFESTAAKTSDTHGKEKKSTSYGPSTFFLKKDKLNLSGLLNVLDGVVDTPGRIVIMTTNHPEMLDAALIRPGRIDKKILLGHMVGPDVIQLLEHYFQCTLSASEQERVLMAVDGCNLRLSPAQVEQMAVEFDELDEMLRHIESMAPAAMLAKLRTHRNCSLTSYEEKKEDAHAR